MRILLNPHSVDFQFVEFHTYMFPEFQELNSCTPGLDGEGWDVTST